MIGALIGKQKGRNIEVMNSFELHFDAIDKDVVIDMEYYNTKEEQCKTYEPPHGKTNNVVSEQVRHKPAWAVIEAG